MTRLYLRFFGRFQATLDDKPLKITSPRSQAMLAWLVLQPVSEHSRETIAALLYPDRDANHGLQNLRKSLSRLRKTLGDQLVVKRDRVHLNPDADWGCDVVDWQQAIQQKRWQAAIALYKDDFLLDLGLESAEFETWHLLKQEWMRREHLQALARQTERSLQANKPAEAYRFAWSRVEKDQFDEAAHRDVMRTLALQGRPHDAINHYERLVELLHDELAVRPATATDELLQAIKNNVLQPAEHGGDEHQPSQTNTNLPTPATPFVGRERLLETIEKRLNSAECRLLTLLGMGGMGKTRLSIEVGRRQQNAFEDGVWFVPLAGLDANASLDAFIQTVAVAIGVSLPRQASAQACLEHLVDRFVGQKGLLIFDNYEHVSDRVELLQALLTQAPTLKILVTSREQLNLQAEWLIDISGFTFPPLGWDGGLPAALEFEAVALFCSEAERVDGTFKPTLDVVRITQLVNGMPLAIQLAARWCRQFSLDAIAQQIEQNIDFLASKQRDLPRRHRSIRAVFEQTWRLLPSQLQTKFAALSAFRDPFTLEAAQSVAQAGRMDLIELSQLSFLQKEGRFYWLHPLIQQFAAIKCAATDRPDAIRQRHSVYFLDFFDELGAVDSVSVVDTISTHFHDIEAAWWVAIERGDFGRIQTIHNRVMQYFEATATPLAGFNLFSASCESIEHHHPHEIESDGAGAYLYCDLRLNQAAFAFALSKFDHLIALGEQTLAIAQRLENVSAESSAHYWLAMSKNLLGDGAAARQHFEKSFTIAKALGNDEQIVDVLVGMSEIENQFGNYAVGKQFAERALKTSLELENAQYLIHALTSMATCYAYQGDFASSLTWRKQAFEVASQSGNTRRQLITANNLGMTHVHLGEYAQATVYFKQALPKMRAMHDPRGVGLLLGNLGDSMTQTNAFDGALAQLTAANAHYKQFNQPDGRADNHRRTGLLLLRLGQLDLAHLHLAQAIDQYKVLENHRGLAHAYTFQAIGYLWQADFSHAQQAVDLARVSAENSTQDRAHAHAFLAAGWLAAARTHFAQARDSFNEAYALFTKLKRLSRAYEALAGLALAYAARGEQTIAQQHAATLHHVLQDSVLHGAIDPVAVYLACADLVQSVAPERSSALLADAVVLLDSVSAEISSPLDRHFYRTNIPSHRQLIQQTQNG